ncbi:MAG TPA: hypothetical protein VKV18_14295 [Chthonomonas sp.]|uniref:hypothetical protein n=1 Tax=Chthonomonas sp. TaxID=2282153 RepID=UPI002B4B2B06|nr:hypothetical protein [Chthonomonas sp.]HLI49840.1 hypothetical protein [Chthonomonas sp.]
MSLPYKTLQEVVLPNGERLVLRPLNAFQRYEARFQADLYAAQQLLPWGDGQPSAFVLQAQFEQMPEEERRAYLLKAYEETLEQEAEIGCAHLPPPQRQAEETEMAFALRVKAWQEQGELKRGEWLRKRLEAEQTRLAGLSIAEQVAACCNRWRERAYREAFATRFLLEALAWSARVAEDPKRRRYESAEAVADLEDADLNALIEGYLSLDTVRESEVPTSPPPC